MGQYFKIVNPAKRQYLDAGKFDEGVKSSSVLYGYHAVAVALLVCSLDQVRYESGKPRHDYGTLAGSWCGDPIFIAGDDNGKPDELGIKTSTEQNPDRNLYWMAKEEFDDISYKALAMLCEGRSGFAEEIVGKVDEIGHYSLIVHLGNVVFQERCKPLETTLEKIVGSDWTRKYKKAREEATWL